MWGNTEENKTLIVKTVPKNITVTYNRNTVAIKIHQMDLSLYRKECNAHIIDRFNQEITLLIEEAFTREELKTTMENPEIRTIEVQIDNVSYLTSFSTPIAKALLYLPKEIMRMKWEEKFNCNTSEQKSFK